MDEKQKQLADIIINIIQSWKNTNDFSSPTLKLDIKEEISKFDHLALIDKQELYHDIKHILGTIKCRVV